MGNAKVWKTYSWAFLGTVVVLLCCVFILKVTVSRPADRTLVRFFCYVLFELFPAFSQQVGILKQMQRGRAHHFSGQQHAFMGNRGTPLRH